VQAQFPFESPKKIRSNLVPKKLRPLVCERHLNGARASPLVLVPNGPRP
jgi:hypothetical protein